MVKYCCKCGGNNKTDENTTFFTIPAEVEGSEWHSEFIKRLGLGDIKDKEIYVCSRHFKPEDIEVEGYMWSLKENVLPIENGIELEEELIVKPEIVYLNCHVDDSLSDSSESKELASLEPLVEYVYAEEEDSETNEPIKQVYMEERVNECDVQAEEVIQETKYVPEEDGSQVISVVQSEKSNAPMMPFFLTSSPVFTITDDNSEVGETIILQIDQSEASEKQPAVTTEQLCTLQDSLCTTRRGNIIGEYTCDICDNSYGCLNCLKSHYETFHIAGSLMRYKCKLTNHISKNTVCPVCDRMFATREETLDHYITHSVACELCGSGFDRQAHLIDHYKTTHTKIAYSPSYACELCKTGYQYPGSLSKHYQTFHRMVLCHVCKLRFINVHELQDHEIVHREKLTVLPFACSKCDKAFPRISDIVVHIRTDHKRGGGGRERKKEERKADVVKLPLQKKVKVKK